MNFRPISVKIFWLGWTSLELTQMKSCKGRIYDQRATALAPLKACPQANPVQSQRLKQLMAGLDPLGLKEKIEQKLRAILRQQVRPSLHQSGLESANPSADLNKRRLRRPALWLVCSDPRSPPLTLPKLFFPSVSFLIQATRASRIPQESRFGRLDRPMNRLRIPTTHGFSPPASYS